MKKCLLLFACAAFVASFSLTSCEKIDDNVEQSIYNQSIDKKKEFKSIANKPRAKSKASLAKSKI